MMKNKEELNNQNSNDSLEKNIINEVKKDPELNKAMRQLPEEDQVKLAQRVGVLLSQQFSGPTPPPGILREYEKISPGIAKRMLEQPLELMQKQVEHRILIENSLLKNSDTNDKMGLWFGLIFSVLVLGAGIFISTLDPHSGAAVITVTLVAGLSLFISKQHYKSKEVHKERVDIEKK